MQRYGSLISIHPEKIEEYKRLYTAVWPKVLSIITTFNIRNYSIFLREPENLLFSYFEYHGSDFAKDMAHMATDPRTQAWWKVYGPCQQPLPTYTTAEW
jgi:L-rhamnose mutarotase